MKLIKIKPRLFEEALIPSGKGAVRIEVVADREFDCGVLDDRNYKKFVVADSDDEVEKLDWHEQVKNASFSFTPPNTSYCWLVLWNAYSDSTIAVAYSVRVDEPQ